MRNFGFIQIPMSGSEFKCECGKIFSLKHHLKRHEDSCGGGGTRVDMVNIGIINNVGTQNNTQNIDADGVPESMKAQVEAAEDTDRRQKLEETRLRIATKVRQKEAREECHYL